MESLNSRVVLTQKQPEELTFSSIIEIHAQYGVDSQLIAMVQHENETAAKSIAKHICLLPKMVEAIEYWNKLQNTKDRKDISINDAVVLQTKLSEVMEELNEGLYGEV